MHSMVFGYGIYDDFRRDQNGPGAPLNNKNACKGISTSAFSKRLTRVKTANNKPIKGLTYHAERQIKNHGVWEKNVVEALEKGKVSKSKTIENAETYDYNGTRVAVWDDRVIHTVTYKGKKEKLTNKKGKTNGSKNRKTRK